jgi:hypothetical protein
MRTKTSTRLRWLSAVFLTLLTLGSGTLLRAQCDFVPNEFPIGGVAAPTIGLPAAQLTTCNFSGEYFVMTGAVVGQQYIISSNNPTDFLTIYNPWPTAITGTGSVSFIAAAATIEVHVASDATCTPDTNCRNISGEAPGAPPTPPANDACASATAIVQDGGPLSSTNVLATLDGPQAACAVGGNPVANDVWFSFVAGSACVEVETFAGSLTDSKLQVLDACGGTVLACNDDKSFIDLMSLVSVTGLNVGSTYFIQVDGWSGSQGTFDVEVRSAVCPGDNCAGALSITQNAPAITVNNTGYTPDGPAMACAFLGDVVTNDIWYAFTALSDCVDIETFSNGGITDTKLQVLDACGGTVLGCNDDYFRN